MRGLGGEGSMEGDRANRRGQAMIGNNRRGQVITGGDRQ